MVLFFLLRSIYRLLMKLLTRKLFLSMVSFIIHKLSFLGTILYAYPERKSYCD